MAVNVPTSDEHIALAARVTQLEMRVTQLESVPVEPPMPDYVVSGPITATAGQHIKRVRITGCAGTAITIRNVSDVMIEDVQIDDTGGHGVLIDNCHDIMIVNSFIRTRRTKTTLDTQLGICIRNNSYDILIQGNVFKECESSVHATGGKRIVMRGNYSEYPAGPFPRGQHIQVYPCNPNGPDGDGVVIEDNYFVAESGSEPINDRVGVEDAINIGKTSAYAKVYRNYIIGGRAESGCGILFEGNSDHGHVKDNIMIRTSQVGCNIVESAYAIVENNKALDTNLSAEPNSENLGNLGLGGWYHTGDTGCHDNVFRNNIVSNKLASGKYNDIWLKGGCGTQTDNTKGDAARALLTPENEKMPPPPIPPKPWKP